MGETIQVWGASYLLSAISYLYEGGTFCADLYHPCQRLQRETAAW